jgi:RNA polymerase sigma-70 factor (ECF subfamily)
MNAAIMTDTSRDHAVMMFGDAQESASELTRQFHSLLLTILPSLRRQAMSLTRHRADAEDLVQTAMASALAAQASFQPGTNFRAWVTCILHNRFFSDVRRRRKLVDLDDIPAVQLGRSGGQEDNIEVREIRRHLLRLPADQRDILLMISVQGLSYEAASARLGVAVGTLKCRVFRARTQLRIWVAGDESVAGAATQTKAIAQR